MEFKNTNRIGVALKIAIVFLAVGYIAWRLLSKQHIDFSLDQIGIGIGNHLFIFFAVVLLMPLNWFLEALKWKLIASTKIKISMKEAIQGVLAGVTIGTATPNRVGEFAGRIFMLKEGNRVELLLLSFISSFCQVFVTIVFGIFGFLMLGHEHLLFLRMTFYFLFLGGIVFCAIPLWIRFLPVNWKKKLSVLLNFSRKELLKALFISGIRYMIYACQFLLLIYIFVNPQIWHFRIFLSLIMISYFIVTIIPTFSFTEVFVRGTVAGAVFNACDDMIFSIGFTVAVLLWTINVAIPSLIGTFFVFQLKFFKTKK
jgi:hypothetical protein